MTTLNSNVYFELESLWPLLRTININFIIVKIDETWLLYYVRISTRIKRRWRN